MNTKTNCTIGFGVHDQRIPDSAMIASLGLNPHHQNPSYRKHVMEDSTTQSFEYLTIIKFKTS